MDVKESHNEDEDQNVYDEDDDDVGIENEVGIIYGYKDCEDETGQ